MNKATRIHPDNTTRIDGIRVPITTTRIHTPVRGVSGVCGDGSEVTRINRRRFTLTLEADGSRDEADAIRKLRALLKRLGRTYGYRCLSIRPEATPTPRGEQ